MDIREIDTADWADWERACVDFGKPYEVISSPYGETVSETFATEAEALKAAEIVAGRMGCYTTSWGEQPVNTQATILHYVDSTPTAPTAAQLTDAVIAAETAHHDARAAVREAEAKAAGTHMGSPEWYAVAEADALVATTHLAWTRATMAASRS